MAKHTNSKSKAVAKAAKQKVRKLTKNLKKHKHVISVLQTDAQDANHVLRANLIIALDSCTDNHALQKSHAQELQKIHKEHFVQRQHQNMKFQEHTGLLLVETFASEEKRKKERTSFLSREQALVKKNTTLQEELKKIKHEKECYTIGLIRSQKANELDAFCRHKVEKEYEKREEAARREHFSLLFRDSSKPFNPTSVCSAFGLAQSSAVSFSLSKPGTSLFNAASSEEQCERADMNVSRA